MTTATAQPINTNTLIDDLCKQASKLDAAYAEACLDSCCTNERRTDKIGALVFDLTAMAYRLNEYANA